jgi:tetratricopeptide (TPR) repeat protein
MGLRGKATTGRLVLILLTCAVLALLLGCSTKEEKKGKHLKRAEQYLEKNELKKAVIELKNVVQLDPEDDEAFYRLGETSLKLKLGREAFQAFSRAVSINPNNLKAQLKIGQLLLLGRRTAEAREKAEFILDKSPQDIEALALLSGIQIQEKDTAGALETLKQAASLEPNRFKTRLSLGRVYLLKGDHAEAEKAYRKAITLDAGARAPYLELSRLYASQGHWDKAENELKNLIEASGSDYQNLKVLARFYESTKNWDRAEKTYLDGVRSALKEDVGPLVELGGFYARRNSYDKALEAFEKALAVKKDDPNILLLIGQLQLDFKHPEEGEATIDRALELDKGHLAANFLKGRLYLQRKDFANALERFDHVTRESPRNAAAYYFKALCQIGKGEPKLAEQNLVKAVELNPQLLNARLLLGETYLRERNEDLAREQIEAALRQAPTNTKVLMLSGNLKILERDAKGAEAAFKKVVELDPTFAPGYVRLGLLYNLTGRKADALKQFQRALDLDPQQTDALALMVGIHVRDKKYDEALRLCEIQKEKISGSPAKLALIEYLEGNLFKAQGASAEAQKRYEKAMAADPNLLAPYVALARIYVEEQRLEDAISQYEAVLTKDPNYVAGYMALGTIYDQKGDGEKAEIHYRKALKIKNDFAPAANNLAWNLAERGKNLDEALGFAQIAKEQMPDNPSVMDTLGWIYYLKESYLSAIAEFNDSLSREPDNAIINYHMGMAQYRNNQADKAKLYLEKALEAEEDFKGAQEARRVLRDIEASSAARRDAG